MSTQYTPVGMRWCPVCQKYQNAIRETEVNIGGALVKETVFCGTCSRFLEGIDQGKEKR